jgi:hypothetical protein
LSNLNRFRAYIDPRIYKALGSYNNSKLSVYVSAGHHTIFPESGFTYQISLKNGKVVDRIKWLVAGDGVFLPFPKTVDGCEPSPIWNIQNSIMQEAAMIIRRISKC